MRGATNQQMAVSEAEAGKKGPTHQTGLRSLAVGIILLPLWWCWGGGQARAQDSLPALVKRIQPAVVTVVGYSANDKVIRLGSGFFVSADGHLITNGHVISGVARAAVKLPKGGLYPLTTVLAEDKNADLVKLAVKIPGGTPHYLEITGDRPEVGEHVLVVGSPLGLEQSVSEGLVSAIRTVRGRGEFLQISAPISPGSSGGPVVNLKGQVIGVATFQVRGQNINFAVLGSRVLDLRAGPPRPIKGSEAGKIPLPPRPGVQVPSPQMQVPGEPPLK
jgi:S1-C subfamily serine protease